VREGARAVGWCQWHERQGGCSRREEWSVVAEDSRAVGGRGAEDGWEGLLPSAGATERPRVAPRSAGGRAAPAAAGPLRHVGQRQDAHGGRSGAGGSSEGCAWVPSTSPAELRLCTGAVTRLQAPTCWAVPRLRPPGGQVGLAHRPAALGARRTPGVRRTRPPTQPHEPHARTPTGLP
jgi:hypothetical protein